MNNQLFSSRSKTITIATILHILCSCHGYTKSKKGKHATTIMVSVQIIKTIKRIQTCPFRSMPVNINSLTKFFYFCQEQHLNGSNNVLPNVVFYNRVSKAGSGTLIEILHLLSSRNGFTMVRDGGIKWGRELLMLSYEEQVSILQYNGIPDFKLYKVWNEKYR